jgi:hypothetical protein
MRNSSHRRRRSSIPAGLDPVLLAAAEGGWITLSGHGSGFDDCPLCRELAASHPEGIPARVEIPPESLPLLARTGWLDDLVELVGPNATVQVMGRELETEPVEVLTMATFLSRLGYE